jgi:hypothetical protein
LCPCVSFCVAIYFPQTEYFFSVFHISLIMDQQFLDKILCDLGYNYKITSFSLTSQNGVDKEYDAEVRSEVQNTVKDSPQNVSHSEKCDLWVKEFGKITNTEWNTRETWPNSQRFQYRKRYVCHHSSFKKTDNLDYKKMPRSKDKDCNAYIDIKIKTDSEHTRKKDSFLIDGLIAIIKVFLHYKIFKYSKERKTFLFNCLLIQSFSLHISDFIPAFSPCSSCRGPKFPQGDKRIERHISALL